MKRFFPCRVWSVRTSILHKAGHNQCDKAGGNRIQRTFAALLSLLIRNHSHASNATSGIILKEFS